MFFFIYKKYRAKFCNKEAVEQNTDVKFDVTFKNKDSSIYVKRNTLLISTNDVL